MMSDNIVSRLTRTHGLVPDPNVGLVGVCLDRNHVVPSLLVGDAGVSPYVPSSVALHLLHNVSREDSVRRVFGRGGVVSYRRKEPDTACRGSLYADPLDIDFHVWCGGTYANVPVWRRLSGSELLSPDIFRHCVRSDGTMHVYLYANRRWRYWSPLCDAPEFTSLAEVCAEVSAL